MLFYEGLCDHFLGDSDFGSEDLSEERTSKQDNESDNTLDSTFQSFRQFSLLRLVPKKAHRFDNQSKWRFKGFKAKEIKKYHLFVGDGTQTAVSSVKAACFVRITNPQSSSG